MEDPNSWNCHVCTYKNKPEAFRCLLCSGSRGTSTRKPRISQEAVTQQVLRQQEQIKQQALKAAASAAKPREKVRRSDENSNSSVASNNSGPASPQASNESNSFLGPGSSFNSGSASTSKSPSEEADDVDTDDELNGPGPSKKPTNGQTNGHTGNNGNTNGKGKTKQDGGDGGRKQKRVRALEPPIAISGVDRTEGVETREVTVNNVCFKVTEFRLKPEFLEKFKLPEKQPVKILPPLEMPTDDEGESASRARPKVNKTTAAASRRRQT